VLARLSTWTFNLALIGFYYLRRRLASGEGIVSLGVRLCMCPPSRDCTRH